MNTYKDEILNGTPKYNIYNNDGSTLAEDASIELSTAVTQEGTALNKAFFDSIKSDLDSRLLIANKATTTEAETGTDNSKYETPTSAKASAKKWCESKLISSGTVTTGSATVYTVGTKLASENHVKIHIDLHPVGSGTGFDFVTTIAGLKKSGIQIYNGAISMLNTTSSASEKITSNNYNGYIDILIDLATLNYTLKYYVYTYVSNSNQGYYYTDCCGTIASGSTISIVGNKYGNANYQVYRLDY